MDYLVAEGYPKAAEHFASEANVSLPDSPYVQTRVEVQHAIYAGDLETAIQKINDWNPQVSVFYNRLITPYHNRKPLNFCQYD